MFIELDWLIQTINQLNWFWLVWIVSSVHLNSPIITYSWIILVFRAYKKLIFRNYNSLLYFYFILFFIYNGRNQTKANKPQRAGRSSATRTRDTHILNNYPVKGESRVLLLLIYFDILISSICGYIGVMRWFGSLGEKHMDWSNKKVMGLNLLSLT